MYAGLGFFGTSLRKDPAVRTCEARVGRCGGTDEIRARRRARRIVPAATFLHPRSRSVSIACDAFVEKSQPKYRLSHLIPTRELALTAGDCGHVGCFRRRIDTASGWIPRAAPRRGDSRRGSPGCQRPHGKPGDEDDSKESLPRHPADCWMRSADRIGKIATTSQRFEVPRQGVPEGREAPAVFQPRGVTWRPAALSFDIVSSPFESFPR